jgi:glucosamine kinase
MSSARVSRVCLGLDVGGTAARWAVVDAAGAVLAQGSSPGFSAAQWGSATQSVVETALRHCAQAVAEATPGVQPAALAAGLTGWDAAAKDLSVFVAQAFGLPAHRTWLMSDVELACRAHFGPGQGAVLVAGTGSIAAHLDAQGQLHRAGGRGVLLDDAGGGYWIAHEALRAVWRREDEAPGSWRGSVLAQQLFAALGGGHSGDDEWAHTKRFMASASRGQVGALAVAVAEAARQGDALALAVLHQAGLELARLVQAMQQRVGPQPVALCGRVFDLHACIEDQLRQALPRATHIHRSQSDLSVAAAGLARMFHQGGAPGEVSGLASLA